MRKTDIAVLKRDPVMRGLVERYRKPELGGGDPYVDTLKSIVGQQLSGHAARAIWARLEGRFGTDPGRLKRCRVTTLRSVGLSNAKSAAVKLAAGAKISGLFDGLAEKDDSEVSAVLTSLKGVGQWTADMVMMFAMGRRDIWPVGDGGVQRAAAELYGVDGKEDLWELGERFRPARSYAAWYLWRSLEG